jgi:hypothetical protein
LWLLVLVGCAGAGVSLDDLITTTRGLQPPEGDARTVAAGLREALRVGTERSVARTSRVDGFFRNSLIRIPLPDELETAGRGLRAVGLGGQVDELELSMNRAAERAAAEATPVFVDAITSLSITDAYAILRGSERAATDYFEAETREPLALRFAPIVDASMRQVGLAQLYDQVVGQIAALPLVSAPSLDLRAYVTDRALAGLFSVLAQEERRIREDPAARSTALLRQVFGR